MIPVIWSLARGEPAVRGGILDIFAPTASNIWCGVEFWGDETGMDVLGADQRSIPEIDIHTLAASPAVNCC